MEVETLGHTFVYCRVIVPLVKFLEDMVRILHRRFFSPGDSSACSNVLPSLTETEHYMYFAWSYESREMEDSLEGILGGGCEVRTERRGLPPTHQNDKIWANLTRLCRVRVKL